MGYAQAQIAKWDELIDSVCKRNNYSVRFMVDQVYLIIFYKIII